MHNKSVVISLVVSPIPSSFCIGVNYDMRETVLNFACVSAVTILISSPLAAEDAPYDSAKPLPRATLFAPGVISTGDYESHATLTPDGREIYFLKMAPNFSRWSIFVSRYRNGGWSQPEVAPFSGQYQDADPYITADGRHFYFISDRPIKPGDERQSHHDIWVMDKIDSGSPPDESVRLADLALVSSAICFSGASSGDFISLVL